MKLTLARLLYKDVSVRGMQFRRNIPRVTLPSSFVLLLVGESTEGILKEPG